MEIKRDLLSVGGGEAEASELDSGGDIRRFFAGGGRAIAAGIMGFRGGRCAVTKSAQRSPPKRFDSLGVGRKTPDLRNFFLGTSNIAFIPSENDTVLNMRPLTEPETKVLFEKLATYCGKGISTLISDSANSKEGRFVFRVQVSLLQSLILVRILTIKTEHTLLLCE